MAISTPTVQVLIIVLSLVPGYVGILAARSVGNITSTFDRFEKTLWSLIGSGISISIVYFMYVLFVLISDDQSPLLPSVPVTIESFAVGFPLLLTISIGIGISFGYAVRKQNFRYLRRDVPEPTWDYFIKQIYEADTPIEVRVVTKHGPEIRGYIGLAGTSNDTRDLLLVYPQRVQRVDGEITDLVSDGEYVYVSEDAIEDIIIKTEFDLELPGDSISDSQ